MNPTYNVVKNRSTHKLTGQGQWDHDFKGEHDSSTHEVVDSGFGGKGAPPWWPEHAKWSVEEGRVVEMNESEKLSADAARLRERRLAQIQQDEAIHALLRRQARAEGKTVEELESELLMEMEVLGR